MQKSIFQTLSPDDRNQIIALCENHTYQQVLEMIAKPKSDGGMNIHSSVSALCRFYVRHHPLAQRIIIDSQLAEAMDETFFESGDAYFRGIISMTQQRLFASLCEGQSVDKLSPTYRLLLALRRDYYKLLQLRSKSRHELDPVPEKYIDPTEDDNDARLTTEAADSPSVPSISSVPSPKLPTETAATEKSHTRFRPNSTKKARNSTFPTNSTFKNEPRTPAPLAPEPSTVTGSQSASNVDLNPI